MKPFAASAITALLIAAPCSLLHTADAGTLDVIHRNTSGQNRVFAGSGGAVQQSDVSDSSAALSGTFAFTDTAAVEVTEDDPFSNGAANADGTITISDTVTQTSPASVLLTATRSAVGNAMHSSGTGNGISRQAQSLSYRFEIIGDPLKWKITGDFDPGPVTGTQNLRFRRPFTANVYFETNTAGPISASGTVPDNRIVQFEITLNDDIGASAGNPTAADASSFNVTFMASNCSGDADLNGVVDINDVSYVIFRLGNTGTPGEVDGDADDNGIVDVNDISYVIFRLGPC